MNGEKMQPRDLIPFLGFHIVCIAVYLVMFIIWILIAVWVYKDAKRRGENAVLWLLVVLLTGIIGLIIYLVVRKSERAPPPPPPPPPA